MKIRAYAVAAPDSVSGFFCISSWLRIICAALTLLSLSAQAQSVESALQTEIQALSSQKDSRGEGAIAAKKLITQYYSRNAYQPVWTDERRAALRALVRNSTSHGLNPADYHVELLDQPVQNLPAELARREILYTDALARLAYHLRFGKVNPHEIYAEWNYQRSLSDIDPVSALDALVKAPDLEKAVESFGPQLPLYAALRSALVQYAAIANAGGWPKVPEGPPLKPSMRDDIRVPALRARLQASGDLPQTQPVDPNLYDENLQQAVAHFQARHGMERDGAIGKQTLAELNVPVEKRIDQIKVNLERIRWVAYALPSEFILVDIAGFDALMFREGHIVWRSRAMVGKPYRKTPVFRAEMTQVVLNPNWTVPPTILKQDVLPKYKNNPGYLASKGMRLLDERGNPTTGGWRPGLRVVQPPGPENPLGRYKFDMPNDHAVYLHDTPSKEKFVKEARAFSSGCIRLEKARELALLLLSGAPQGTEQQIDEVLATNKTKMIALQRKIPVLILYLTAEAHEQEVKFRPDIYARDARLIAALKEPFRVSWKTN